MSEFNLLKLEGKPLSKLIQVVSQGIGTLYRPRKIRKEADAKAYELFTIERAKALAIKEGKEIELESYLRIHERLIGIEADRQNNIDKVVEIAGKDLSEAEDISDEPISKDWTRRFFNNAQDVSDEEIQFLWGKILAGEIKKPGSFSLRTLEVLKNMNKEEADIFVRIANFVIQTSELKFVWIPYNLWYKKNEHQFSLIDRIRLVECGVLYSEEPLPFAITYLEFNENLQLFRIGNQGIRITNANPTQYIAFDVLKLTWVGQQLFALMNATIEDSYMSSFLDMLSTSNTTMEIGELFINKEGNYDIKNKSERKG